MPRMTHSFEFEDGLICEYQERFSAVSWSSGRTVYKVPDATHWHVHPQFLSQIPEVKTYGQLAEWLNKEWDNICNDDAHHWIGDMLPRAFEMDDNWYPRLREGCNPEQKLFLTVYSDVYDHGPDQLADTFILLEREVKQPELVMWYTNDQALNPEFSRDEYNWYPTYYVGYRPPMAIPDGGHPAYFFTVMNYTFKPDPLFVQLEKERTSRYFGMEIEVSSEMSPLELQKIVTEVEPKQEPFFYFKDDSSISGGYTYLYEIVTHPMTARAMKREWGRLFKKLEQLAEANDLKLSDLFDMSMSLSNGIHIHVSNDAFVKTGNELQFGRRSFHQNRFLTAFNQWDSSFQKWLKRVSKRPVEGRESTYYPPHPAYDGKTLARRLSRYQEFDEHRSACHTNGYTTEVRVFYGLFDLHHICACVEIVDAMLDFTLNSPISSFGRAFVPKFNNFVMSQPGLRYAKEALK